MEEKKQFLILTEEGIQNLAWEDLLVSENIRDKVDQYIHHVLFYANNAKKEYVVQEMQKWFELQKTAEIPYLKKVFEKEVNKNLK